MQIYNMHSIWTYQIRLIERREIQSKWRTVNFGTTALDVKAPLVHKDHFIHVHAALGIGFRLVAIIATTMSRVGSNQEALNNMMCHSSLAFTKIAKNVGVCGFVLTLFYYPKQIRLTNHKATGTSHVFFRSSWGPRLSKTAAKVWHAEISPPQFWKSLNFTPPSSVVVMNRSSFTKLNPWLGLGRLLLLKHQPRCNQASFGRCHLEAAKMEHWDGTVSHVCKFS